MFTNEAFLSCTSLMERVYGSNQARRHIYVPKKAPGGFIKNLSEYPHEEEFVLDKKTKTRILKVEKDALGVIHIYEEVVI